MNWLWSAFRSSYYTIRVKTGVHNDIVETADPLMLFTRTTFTDLPTLSHTDAL